MSRLFDDNLPETHVLTEATSSPEFSAIPEPDAAQLRRSRVKMLLMFAVISAPVIGSYGAYYVYKPTGRSNYGELLAPHSVKPMLVQSDPAIDRFTQAPVANTGKSAVAPESASGARKSAEAIPSQPVAGMVAAPVVRPVPVPSATTGVTPNGGPASPAATPLPLEQLPALQRRWLIVTVGPSDCNESCTRQLFHVRQVRWSTGADMERIERVWLVTDDKAPAAGLLAEHHGLHVLRISEQTLKQYFPGTPATPASDHIFLVDPLGNLMMRFPKNADPGKLKRDLLKLLRASRAG